MKKILFIIIDGLADEPIKALGDKTPLEAAQKPNLNFLAQNGLCGSIEPFCFEWQKYPTSEDSILALLGFDPKRYKAGRGVYEALGAGLNLKSKDIALRVNFASVDKNLIIKDRRAGRIEDTKYLISSLNKIRIKNISFFFKKSLGHRAVLRLRSKKPLSSNITDNDPREVNKKPFQFEPKDRSLAAKFTAGALNDFINKAYFVLKSHFINQERIRRNLFPANYLLIRGAGSFKRVPSFKSAFKTKASFIAGGGLYKGIAKFLGINLINIKGATGNIKTDLKAKIDGTIKALKKTDIVFLHIKAADNLAEDGNFSGKRAFIERIDKSLRPLITLKDCLIVVTADHKTCCEKKSHCPGPVPFVIFGGDRNGTDSFDEKSCGKEKIPAKDFLKFVMSLQKK